MDKNLFDSLLRRSTAYMEKDRSFHDVAHVKNVLKNAKKLIKLIGGDEIIIFTALLFHDIRRDVDNHEKIGADETEKMLKSIAEFPNEKIKEICLAIERHEKGQITKNEKVVSDADKMDAFTEIGFVRGFMMLAKKGYTLKQGIVTYLDLLGKWYKEFYFDESRILIKRKYEIIQKALKNMLSMY